MNDPTRAEFRRLLEFIRIEIGEGSLKGRWPFWPRLDITSDEGTRSLGVSGIEDDGLILFTQFSIDLRHPVPVDLRIGRFWSPFSRLVPLNTPDSDFNSRFHPQASINTVPGFLDECARRDIRQLFGLNPRGVTLVIEPRVICIYKNGYVADPATLLRFYLLASSLASWILARYS